MLTCKIPRRYRISSWHCLIITFEESRQKMCFIIFLWSVSICHITHSYEAILWDLQVYLQRHEVAKLELCLSDTVESQGLSYCHTQNFIKHRCVFPLYFSYLSFIPSFESSEWEICFRVTAVTHCPEHDFDIGFVLMNVFGFLASKKHYFLPLSDVLLPLLQHPASMSVCLNFLSIFAWHPIALQSC